MLVYDLFITIEDEVEYVWKKPINVVSVIFILNRYILPGVLVVDIYGESFPYTLMAPFFDTVLVPTDKVSTHSDEFCKGWILLRAYLVVMGFVSMHAMVCIRINAMYNGCGLVRVLLWVGGLLYTCSTSTIMTVGYANVLNKLSAKMPNGACVPGIPPYLWVAWVPTIVFETITFLLTMHFILFRLSKDSLYHTFLCLEGTIYFFIVIAAALFSLITWKRAATTSLVGLSRPFSSCMVTMAGNRLVLSLRKLVSQEKHGYVETKSQGPVFSNFEFAIYNQTTSMRSAYDTEDNHMTQSGSDDYRG